MQIGSSVPPGLAKKSPLFPRGDTAEESKKLRDDVVEPLKRTIEVTGVTLADPQAWRGAVGSNNPLEGVDHVTASHLTAGLRGVTTGLGATGSALGGVLGMAQLVQGAREGKPRLILSGATEITLATATLATIGLVPGGACLAPVGASLLGMRALNDVNSNQGVERMDGWRDLVTSASVSAALLHAPTAVVASLGVTALGFNALRGLSKIQRGHEQKDGALSAQGHGALLSALGVGLITSGVGMAPGVGLLLAGAALPLLQRWQRTQGAVDRLTGKLDPLFYPAAVRADKVESAIQKKVKPVLDPAFRWSSQLWHSKPLQPVRLSSRWAGRSLSQASEKVADKLHGWAGKFRATVKPPP